MPRRRRADQQLDLFKPVQLSFGLPKHAYAREQYRDLLSRFVDAVKAGAPPWKQPWFNALPANALTHKRYRGTNVPVLLQSAARRGFESRFWVTQRQAAQLGGWVRDEEMGNATVIFGGGWRERRVPSQVPREDGEPVTKWELMLRLARVYNCEQCESLPDRKEPHPLPHERLETAECIAGGYPDAPRIEFNRSQAFYEPFWDSVGMPFLELFETREAYYATLFHELVHSTGHQKRLRRYGNPLEEAFAGHETSVTDYAKEELVAEIGGALLCLEAGISNATVKNSEAYLVYWAQVLDSNPRWLHSAFAQAERAVDWIMKRQIARSDRVPPSGDISGLHPPVNRDTKWV